MLLWPIIFVLLCGVAVIAVIVTDARPKTAGNEHVDGNNPATQMLTAANVATLSAPTKVPILAPTPPPFVPAVLKDPQVVVCAVMRNEELYIDEWLRYIQYLGFDSVHIYDNADTPSEYYPSLKAIYGDFITVKWNPGIQVQQAAYSHCAGKFKKNNTWAAFFDADEFIVLRKHKNIKEFLADVAPTGGSVVLNWNIMSNNGIKKHRPGPVTSRFTYAARELTKYVKSISYVDHVTWISVHNGGVIPGYPKVDPLGHAVPNIDSDWLNNTGVKEVAYLNHYYTKSLQEFTLKKRRGQAAQPNRGNYNITVEDLNIMFEKYNEPYHEVEDTHARDFYLRHYLGHTYDVLTKHGNIGAHAGHSNGGSHAARSGGA